MRALEQRHDKVRLSYTLITSSRMKIINANNIINLSYYIIYLMSIDENYFFYLFNDSRRIDLYSIERVLIN